MTFSIGLLPSNKMYVTFKKIVKETSRVHSWVLPHLVKLTTVEKTIALDKFKKNTYTLCCNSAALWGLFFRKPFLMITFHLHKESLGCKQRKQLF